MQSGKPKKSTAQNKHISLLLWLTVFFPATTLEKWFYSVDCLSIFCSIFLAFSAFQIFNALLDRMSNSIRHSWHVYFNSNLGLSLPWLNSCFVFLSSKYFFSDRRLTSDDRVVICDWNDFHENWWPNIYQNSLLNPHALKSDFNLIVYTHFTKRPFRKQCLELLILIKGKCALLFNTKKR